MLKPFYLLVDALTKHLAKEYIDNITFNSIPFWKGEITIDDFKSAIKDHGINIRSGKKYNIELNKLEFARCCVKIPLLSPGTNPLHFIATSLDVDISMIDNSGNHNVDDKTVENREVDKNEKTEKLNYGKKLTSNIKISVDGVHVNIFFKAIEFCLVAQDLELEVVKGAIGISLKKLVLQFKFEGLSIEITSDALNVHVSDEGVNVVTENTEITVLDPILITVIKNAHVNVFSKRNGELIIKSEKPVHVNFDIRILDSIFSLINSLNRTDSVSRYKPLPIFNIDLRNVIVKVILSDSLAIEVGIKVLTLINSQVTLKPLELRLLLNNGTFPLVDPIIISGTITQVHRSVLIQSSIKFIKIVLPFSKDFLQEIKDIKYSIRKLNRRTRKYDNLIEKTLYFLELPNVETNGKVISFEFDTPIIPVSINFDKLVDNNNKILLRVWDDSIETFIAFSSFDCSDKTFHFNFDPTQMIPIKKFQIILQNDIKDSKLLVNCNFSYMSDESLSEGILLDIKINKIIISLDTFQLPSLAVSVSDIILSMFSSPDQYLKLYASLSFSVFLTNFRNSTMSTILDIPIINVSLSKIPSYSDRINCTDRRKQASVLQKNICSNSESSSIKIPSISVNIIPSILFDFLRFTKTLTANSCVAYTLCNLSDTPFVFQKSTSPGSHTIDVQESKVIVFDPNQSHYIFFPAISMKIPFNKPAFYHISENNYIEVSIIDNCTYKVIIYSSTHFINYLSVPVSLTIISSTFSTPFNVNIDIDSVLTLSNLLDVPLQAKLQIVNITDSSEYVTLTPKAHSPAVFLKCDVLNMLPPAYLCAPYFCALIVFRKKEILCENGGYHKIQEYSIIPILIIKNMLNTHILTSSGVVKPHSRRYIAELSEKQIVFDNCQTIKISFPLKKMRVPMTVMEQPCIIESNPDSNTLVISSSYVFRNESAVPLLFSTEGLDNIYVEPEKMKPISSLIIPEFVSVGYKDKNDIRWSKPIPIPSRTDIYIHTSIGSLFLIADSTKSKLCVYPKYIAINESDQSIWFNSSSELQTNTQSQLLFWKGKVKAISVSLDPKSEYSAHIDLDANFNWIRHFSGQFPQSEFSYITYSVQNKVNPHSVIFHKDISPPLSILNRTPTSFTVICSNCTVNADSQKNVYLPFLPSHVIFSRVGADPFTVSLQHSSDLIITSASVTFYVRVCASGIQAFVMIKDSPHEMPIVYPKLFSSLFVNEIKVFLYDDINDPGIPELSYVLTISPVSLDLNYQKNNTTKISFGIDVFQLDCISNFKKFPVILYKKSRDEPFLKFYIKLCSAIMGHQFVDSVILNISPMAINIEEVLVRFLLRYAELIPNKPKEEQKVGSEVTLTPRFIRKLYISDTNISLSLSTQTIINAHFQNVFIHLSHLALENNEIFDVTILEIIFSHYVSDIIAAIPNLVTSFSLIGSPSILVTNVLKSFKSFFVQTFSERNGIVVGVGKGSLMLLRGISTGALESIVSLTSSLENSIGKLNPISQNESQLSSLIALPVDGYHRNGFTGAMSGTWKAFIGAITAPTTGLLSFINSTGNAAIEKISGDTETDIRIHKESKELPTIPFEK